MGSVALRHPRRSGRELTRSAAGWLLFWLGVALFAVVVARSVEASPVLAIAPAVVVAVAWVSARFPAFVLLVACVLGGMYATADVELGISPYVAMQLLLLGLWIAAAQGLIRERRERGPLLWGGLVAIMTLTGLALLWVGLADDAVAAFASWRQIYLFMLVGPLVALAPWRGIDSDKLARVFLVAGCLVTGYALLRLQIGPSANEKDFAVSVGGGFNQLEGELRPLGGVGDAHALSSLMVPLIPFAFALALGLQGRWRLVAIALFAGAGLMLVKSDVRAGMVASIAGLAAVLCLLLAARSLGGRRLAAVYVGLMLCVGVVGGVVAFEGSGTGESSERFRRILTPEQDPAFQSRLFVWSDSLAQVENRPFGQGLGTSEHARENLVTWSPTLFNNDPVNSYLRVALEQGVLFAVLLIAAMLALLLAIVARAIGGASGRQALYATAAAGTLTAFMVELNFESIYIGIGTALVAWAIVGLGMRQVSWPGAGGGAGVATLSGPPALAPPPAAPPAPDLPAPPAVPPAASQERSRVLIGMPFAESLSGAERLLETVVARAPDHALDVEVVFLAPGPFERELAARGVHTSVVPVGRLRHLGRGRKAVGELTDLIRRRSPDVVLGWLPRAHMYMAPAARFAGTGAAVAWWQHHVPTGAAFERLATAVPADAVICSSRAAADAQRTLRPSRRCVVCHPGVAPPERVGPERLAELRQRAGIAAGRKVLAIVGRQVSWKGQDRFVAALARLVASGHDVHGVVVGGTAHDLEPEYAARVRRLVSEAGLDDRCTLTGHVQDPLPWIQLADVLVSASEVEPFGLTLLEAMALERPVVAVGRGGPAEIVEHGESGWLVPAASPESLAEGVGRLLDDPDLRARLAAGGRARYTETFTAEAMGERLAAVIRQLSRVRA